MLERDTAIELTGRFYSVKNLKMTPPLPRELRPEIFVSGSSPAGMAAATELAAIAVRYPQPVEFEAADREAIARGVKCGARVSIIAREDGEEARHVALERFPPDRRGQLAHQMAMKVSDSVWHQQLSQLDEHPLSEDNPYWLSPMQNYKTFCPYLVVAIPVLLLNLDAISLWDSGHSSWIFRQAAANLLMSPRSSVGLQAPQCSKAPPDRTPPNELECIARASNQRIELSADRAGET